MTAPTYPYVFASLTAAQMSYLDANFNTIPFWGPAQTLASAATTDLGTAGTICVNITGTATISSFGSSASSSNPIYFVVFSGAATVSYNASTLILPGAVNITTNANDCMICQYQGSGAWKVLAYLPSTGRAIVSVTAIPAITGTPSSSTYLRGDGTWTTPSGAGNVVGPASSVSGHIATFNGTTGTILQDSGITISTVTTSSGSQQAINFGTVS